VAPWDLAERPFVWQRWAAVAELAEAEAKEELAKQHGR
jgi:hypothetical protein